MYNGYSSHPYYGAEPQVRLRRQNLIPLRDNIRSRRFPIINIAFIALNVVVFLFENMLSPPQLDHLIAAYGLVPAEFWQGGGLSRWVPVFSSMFLHGGWWHLISNMLALYIFGDNVEDRTGRLLYPLFYLCSGLAASAAHLTAYGGSTMPTIGASGAIAGVLGAYLVLFPRARVVTLVPIFYFLRIIQIPALIYLGFWFVSQLFNGVASLAAADVFQRGGVAWWAHVGGFVFGLAVIRFIASGHPDYHTSRYRPWRGDRW